MKTQLKIYTHQIVRMKNHLPTQISNFFDLYVEVQRMPPTLRPFRYRSFGHFILTSSAGKPCKPMKFIFQRIK